MIFYLKIVVDRSYWYHFSLFLILYRFSQFLSQSVFENVHQCGFSKKSRNWAYSWLVRQTVRIVWQRVSKEIFHVMEYSRIRSTKNPLKFQFDTWSPISTYSDWNILIDLWSRVKLLTGSHFGPKHVVNEIWYFRINSVRGL